MPRKGRALEKLVAHLERILADRDGISIESPGYLVDTVTGQRREFDVLVTFTQAHHTVRIVMEVRDWRRDKIGSPQIEAFKTKTDHTPCHVKLFVSSSGFTQPALKKAEMCGIRCLAIEQVESLPWFSGMRGLVRHLRPLGWACRVVPCDQDAALAEGEKLDLSQELGSIELVGASGQAIPWDAVRDRAWAEVARLDSEGQWAATEGERSGKVRFELAAPFFMRWKGSSSQFPLDWIEATIAYVVEVIRVPHVLRDYRVASNGAEIAQVVESAKFPALGGTASLTMVKPTGGDIVVSVRFGDDRDTTETVE